MPRRCLFVICVLLIAAEAHATVLEITSGSVSSVGDPLTAGITAGSFGGTGFTASVYNGDVNYVGGPAFGFGFTGGFSTATTVSVDGFPPCSPGFDPFASCGRIQFVIDPMAPVVNGDFADYVSTVHFTATGNVDTQPVTGPLGVPTPCCDIAGEGFVTLRYQLSSLGPSSTWVPDATFSFVAPEPAVAPEPSTLALLSMGILALLLGRRLSQAKDLHLRR